jgi:hypothetical protein
MPYLLYPRESTSTICEKAIPLCGEGGYIIGDEDSLENGDGLLEEILRYS